MIETLSQQEMVDPFNPIDKFDFLFDSPQMMKKSRELLEKPSITIEIDDPDIVFFIQETCHGWEKDDKKGTMSDKNNRWFQNAELNNKELGPICSIEFGNGKDVKPTERAVVTIMRGVQESGANMGIFKDAVKHAMRGEPEFLLRK